MQKSQPPDWAVHKHTRGWGGKRAKSFEAATGNNKCAKHRCDLQLNTICLRNSEGSSNALCVSRTLVSEHLGLLSVSLLDLKISQVALSAHPFQSC